MNTRFVSRLEAKKTPPLNDIDRRVLDMLFGELFDTHHIGTKNNWTVGRYGATQLLTRTFQLDAPDALTTHEFMTSLSDMFGDDQRKFIVSSDNPNGNAYVRIKTDDFQTIVNRALTLHQRASNITINTP